MDLETENRIAAILLKEANELRRRAENEGALAYLREPTVRSKPNSRFLTATVLGVQQANRAVEVNEMWRLREKQEELENRIEGRTNRSSSGRNNKDVYESRTNRGRSEAEPSASASHRSKKRIIDDLHSADDEGLRDEEIEEFLHTRTKRGRGAVGSRVDETGPYLPPSPGSKNADEVLRSSRVLLGPEKPSYLNSSEESSDDESLESDKKKAKIRSSKKRSKKHKSERKSKDAKKKKRREEKEKEKEKMKMKRKHRE